MTDQFNDTEASILRGVQDAVKYAKGEKTQTREHKVNVADINVRKEREKLGFSQDEFANAFGVSVATIRNWEQQRRHPSGAAKVLLNVIHKYPEAVLDALHNNTQ